MTLKQTVRNGINFMHSLSEIFLHPTEALRLIITEVLTSQSINSLCVLAGMSTAYHQLIVANDDIWWHRSASSDDHRLKQCWNIINWIVINKLYSPNLKQYRIFFVKTRLKMSSEKCRPYIASMSMSTVTVNKGQCVRSFYGGVCIWYGMPIHMQYEFDMYEIR